MQQSATEVARREDEPEEQPERCDNAEPAPPAAAAPLLSDTAATDATRNGATPLRTGVYVHFPYCLAKCPYCDFVSYAQRPPPALHRAYADAVLRELDRRCGQIGQVGSVRAHRPGAAPRDDGGASGAPRTIESVFFGGGTPSLWDPEQLGRVLAAVRARAAVALPARARAEPEITVECNPTSLDEERARALVGVGVNRISVGVQSLDDERLRFLGRLHDERGALLALEAAQRAGVPRLSADLIFGLPGQSPEDARTEASRLLDLGLEHLSCYQLTIEPGTRFGELARRGRLPLADEGRVADAFLALDELLTSRGFVHYEISNYARPGHEARHNLGYWRGDEYLGLGCAAYGFLRGVALAEADADATGATQHALAVRYRNDVSPERYMAGESGGAGASTSEERLGAETLMRERIMLGLRMAEGVDLAQASRALGVAGWTAARERAASWLESRGRLLREGSRIRIPPPAWLWADDTAARLF
jgi:oxygen-independent coproporphyrinogen-3 oxidase